MFDNANEQHGELNSVARGDQASAQEGMIDNATVRTFLPISIPPSLVALPLIEVEKNQNHDIPCRR